MVSSDPHPKILWHLGYHTAYHYMVKKTVYLSHWLSPDQLPIPVCGLKGCFPLIPDVVLKFHFWPLGHWSYDATLGEMGQRPLPMLWTRPRDYPTCVDLP